jgi:hypothetical protein
MVHVVNEVNVVLSGIRLCYHCSTMCITLSLTRELPGVDE